MVQYGTLVASLPYRAANSRQGQRHATRHALPLAVTHVTLRTHSRHGCHECACFQEETVACLAQRRPVCQTFLRIFATRGGRRAFGLICALMLFQQLSGINAVLFYAEDIFRRAGGDFSPAASTIIIGMVQVVASASTVALTTRISMKMLFICSSLGVSVSHVSVAVATAILRALRFTLRCAGYRECFNLKPCSRRPGDGRLFQLIRVLVYATYTILALDSRVNRFVTLSRLRWVTSFTCSLPARTHPP